MPISADSLALHRRFGTILAITASLLAPSVWASDPVAAVPAKPAPVSPEHAQFFEAHVRPLLAEHCWSCHGPEKQKGDLRLDSLADTLRGGESGPSLTQGKPEESLLIEAIRYESYEMPPSKKLSDEQIAVLTRWVELGAPWPGAQDTPPPRAPKEKFSDEDRAWWAFQPLREPAVPNVAAGELPGVDAIGKRTATESAALATINPIDAFLLDKMRAVGLTPAPPADRITLLRRVYFDLIGLPPTPQQVADFLNDESPDAYERVVESLLDSPHYGERWARHWLDLVRYADSDGYRIDHYRPEAWRYRDYVINSLNQDKPYDRFVQEQIAGDEMFPQDPQALIATGYLRHWIYEYNNRDAKTQWSTILNDITDTTGDVFLGMGMQCAKCHDHKFDPILQVDYFRLQAFFAAFMPRDATVGTARECEQYEQKYKVWERATQEIRDEIATLEAKYRKSAAESAITKFPPDIEAIARKAEADRSPYEKQLFELVNRQIEFEYSRLDSRFKGEEKERIIALRKKLAEFDSLKPKPLPKALIANDVGPVAPPVAIPKKANKDVQPGFLSLLDDSNVAIESVGENSTGRRTTLARWLTRPDNQLSIRVIVNRVWQYHFGKGIAPNSSDFGRLGGEPSHPELLDWLAIQFVRDGWSLKSLHRRILTSWAYRQSTEHPNFVKGQELDPSNQFYWRADTRRLDAEQIRDAILSLSGALVHATTHVEQRETTSSDDRLAVTVIGGEGVMADQPRRSIYTRMMRNARDSLLDVFDLPQFFSSESSRNTTTTPIQSLLLINSPIMLRHANQFAKRIYSQTDDVAQRVQEAWSLAYSRPATPSELSSAMRFLEFDQTQLSQDEQATIATEIATGKIPFRDGQALAISPDNKQQRFLVKQHPKLDTQDFSIESFFQVRTIYDSGAVRTLASKWHGAANKPGWAFGITGKGSRRKPQTLVVQLWGKKTNGTFGEAAIFSDQFVGLNKPYFAAATIKLAGKEPGTVTFYLKDLSNDDDPLSIVTLEHDITGGLENQEAFAIGGRSGDQACSFDGLIDDIRLSQGQVSEEQLLLTNESLMKETIGYWRFEAEPGVMRDSSELSLDIIPASRQKEIENPELTAFTDLCHILLNSNEFLYVK